MQSKVNTGHSQLTRECPPPPLVSLAALVPWERIKIYFAGISVCAENAFVELQLRMFMLLLQMH